MPEKLSSELLFFWSVTMTDIAKCSPSRLVAWMSLKPVIQVNPSLVIFRVFNDDISVLKSMLEYLQRFNTILIFRIIYTQELVQDP